MADYQYITSTGLIVPDTGDLLATVQDEFRAAFGADLIVTANTPQGVLITAETLARDAILRGNATVANQINPNEAGGVFLDAIWALTGGRRVRSTPSLIPTVTVTGQPGVTIPAGSQARVGLTGPIFESAGDVELDGTGNGAIAFLSLDSGPIAAPIGDLDTIASGVLGWEAVSNPVAAILGLATESDQASRTRRRNTLALQGTSLAEAILSALYDEEQVPGLTSALLRENITNAAIVIEGVNLVAHSIFVCAAGGSDVDVATAILAKKSGGCNYNGTTVVNVWEPFSGQIYAVKFQRPAPVPIYMEVTVRASSNVADPAEAVRDAILSYVAGEQTGEDGFSIGGDVSPFELASAVNRITPPLFVSNLLVGTVPGVLSADTIPITIAQHATVLRGDIAVVIV